MELTITKTKFLEWYFESGQDQENEEIKTTLINEVINQLFKTGLAVISAHDLFDDCNQDAIRLSYTEQGNESDYDTELSDLDNYTIELK